MLPEAQSYIAYRFFCTDLLMFVSFSESVDYDIFIPDIILCCDDHKIFIIKLELQRISGMDKKVSK